MPYLEALPAPTRLVGRVFAGEIMRDPAAAAQRRPVFELLPSGGPLASPHAAQSDHDA